jgi:hypothetical protein
MKVFRPGVYLFPVARALGGSRQDIDVECTVPVTKISNNGSLILDEYFMVAIFSAIVDEVEPFEK